MKEKYITLVVLLYSIMYVFIYSNLNKQLNDTNNYYNYINHLSVEKYNYY